ncbi:hypothetical protein RHMOL_Rhmol10G0260000 [Rhododendron molle]|uniref:Uncharacterized protein n=1 Tax=Rhododendron molle TaxID=49168 RepID=A0ACC0M6M3_RHOML|nr:hypothetical protein RHMOL_Rhmol10G0260000 [Rhododendron molle]
MLFLCPWANMVWFGCNIKPFGNLRGNGSAVKWTDDMVKVLGTNKATEFMGRVAAIAWHIWKGRNDFVFKKGAVNPQRTVDSIRHMEREISTTHVIPTVQMDNPLNQEETSTWRAPDVGRLKANCDVALPKSGKKGKAVAMIRNWKGKMMEGVARSVHIASSLGGELYAIRAACEMLLSLGLKEVEVESDNKQAIALSVSELVPPWSVRALVMDIREFAKEGALILKWMRRLANKAAHEVASLALRNSLPCNWVFNPPTSLVTVLENYINGSL